MKRFLTVALCTLSIIGPGLSLLAQNTIHIKGRVLSDNGQPIAKATVVVKGAATGVSSDENGNFEITAPSNGTLTISSIGYAPVDIKIAGRPSIDVTLAAASNALDQVVVVGYGTQRKSDVTGALVSVSDKALKETPADNLTSALQGKAAGVSINTTSTRPGQVGQIRIRGARSLTAGNDPLIIVDGIPFPGSLGDLNMNDIKSLDILKDASATAIYGSRGANGVILITTIRGKTGAARITYNGYQGINTVARYYKLFSPSEFLALRNLTGYTQTPGEIANEAANKTVDWQKLAYQNGTISDHQLDVSGGSDLAQYSLSGGYHNESTVLPGQKFQRFSIRGTLDQKVGKILRVGLNSLDNYTITDGESASDIYSILSFTPFDSPYDSAGNLINYPVYPTEPASNPLLAKGFGSNWIERRKRISSYNSLYGEVQLAKGLKYRMNLGFNFGADQYGNYFGAISAFNAQGSLSTANVSNTNFYSYTVENLLTYEKAFAEKHRLNFTGLYSFEQSGTNTTSVSATDLVTDYLQYYNLGLSNQPLTAIPANQIFQQRDLISYMGRINYSYDDRFLLTATGRIDGSSVLAPGKKYHGYGAASAGWNIANEAFMKKSDLFNALKLRAGFGQTSNQAVNPYSTQGSLAQNNYNFGNSTPVYGYYLNTIPNPNLGWEYTQTWNIGVDFGLLKNRISGSVEVYKQHTKGLLLSQSLPPTTGVPGQYLTNIGQTQNQGLEISLSTVNIQSGKSDGFTWSTDWNFFLNRNKILSLQSGVQQDLGNGWFVGKPIDVIYDYKKVGIWQEGDSALAASYGYRPGQIRVQDRNKDGKIDPSNDPTVLGNFQPSYEFGFTNHFNYKGFDLSVVTFGKVGGQLISLIHQPNSYLNSLNGRRNQIKVNYWTYTNPTNDNPKPTQKDGDNPALGSTLGYFSASYWQIQTVNLGYTFSQKWVTKIAAQSLRIYASCNNVATLFSPYIKAGGLNPMPTGVGAQNGPGAPGAGSPGYVTPRALTVSANTPPIRSFLIGINLRY